MKGMLLIYIEGPMNAFNEHLSRSLEWIYMVLSSSILCVENIQLIEYTRHTYLSRYLSTVYTKVLPLVYSGWAGEIGKKCFLQKKVRLN